MRWSTKMFMMFIVLSYMISNEHIVRSILEILAAQINYRPTTEEMEWLRKAKKSNMRMYTTADIIQYRIQTTLSSFSGKTNVEYVMHYLSITVDFDEDFNPILPFHYELAARFLENFEILIRFCEACKKHLPSIKEQVRFFRYRMLVIEKISNLEWIIKKRFPEVTSVKPYITGSSAVRTFNSLYPIKKLSAFDVYYELKELLKIIPPTFKRKVKSNIN